MVKPSVNIVAMQAVRKYAGHMARGVQLNLRVGSSVIERLDRLAAAVPGWTRAIVAKVAIEEGLTNLEGRFLRAGGKK